VAFSNSAADDIFIIPCNDLTVDGQFYCSSIANFSPDLGVTGKSPLRTRATFAKQKPRNVQHEMRRRLTKRTKEQIMEYLILVAVVAMMALYALIIVGCLKQPEW
jgi:hypothetical protein